MDVAQAQEIVAQGESFTVEFKGEGRTPLNDQSLVEAVVCLANGAGGFLFIGVEDDGRLTGARPRHGAATEPARVQALIANQTIPPVQTEVTMVRLADVDVLVVEVENASRVVGTSRGLYVRRALRVDGQPECVPFPAHEMLAHEIDRGAVDHAGLAAPGAAWADLDPLEFERFRTLVRRAGAAGDASLADLADEDIARALGVATRGADGPVPTIGGLLLFGRPEPLRRYVPTHEVAFQVLRGSRVEVNDFLTGPLLQVAEGLMSRVQARNTEEELQLGLIRVAVPLVPTVAVREAIANALVHRDYTRLGAVRVQLTDDALEIISPGGFPSGVRLDNLLDVSHPRSPILADAFKRAGLVERTGRGINRMFEVLLRVGRDAPDYSKTTEVGVTAVLPTGAADLTLARFVLEREAAVGQPMRLADLQILHELRRESKLSTSEVAALVQQTEAQARAVLTRMVEDGLVEARGSGRGRRYHLAASVYRALDAQAAYVRVRSFDAIQQEQMVLTFVQAHGRITRGQAADLCAISGGQASQLLRRLASSGQLEMRGEKRGAHYVLAGPSVSG